MSAFPRCEQFGQPATFGLYRSGLRKEPCGAATEEYRRAPPEPRLPSICRSSALRSDPQANAIRYSDVHPSRSTIGVPVLRRDLQRPYDLTRTPSHCSEPSDLCDLIGVRHIAVPAFRSPELSRAPRVTSGLEDILFLDRSAPHP